MKQQPKTIWLNRAEGPIEECGAITLTGRNLWKRANLILQTWSETAPQDGCYDKCDFTITYEDGETYTGRYDLKHWSVEIPNLAQHVSDFVTFHAGRCEESSLPEHMQNGAYAKWLASDWTAKVVSQYQHFADNYAIGQ